MAHIDLVRRSQVSQEPGPTGLPPWPDILTRLEHAPYITVGSDRGRARGVGSEFLLALDIRFASREKAIFCQPEIGFGFFPGGGGLERLPLVTGRSRAMEIILGGEDFDAETAERYLGSTGRSPTPNSTHSPTGSPPGSPASTGSPPRPPRKSSTPAAT